MDTRLEVLKLTDVFHKNKIFNSILALTHLNFMKFGDFFGINILDFFFQNSNWFLATRCCYFFFFFYVFCNGEYVLDNIIRN